MSVIDHARRDKNRAWERLVQAQAEFDEAAKLYSNAVRAELDGAAQRRPEEDEVRLRDRGKL